MKISKKFYLSAILLLILFLAQIILINNTNTCFAGSLWDLAEEGGIDEIGDKAFGQSSDNPTDVRSIVVIVINVFLTLLAIIFLIIIVIAGYTWMTAAGNDDKVNEAKAKIRTGIIGLLIVLSAWSISKFILCNLIKEMFDLTWSPC